jgi:hypothetical protein
MAWLLLIRKQKLSVPPWIFTITALYLYLILPVMASSDPPWDTISGTVTVLIGSVCICLVLANKILSYDLLAYSILASAILNVIAILLGIDTGDVIYNHSVEGRVSGLLGNANALANNMMLAAFIVWVRSNQYPRVVCWVAFLTAFYGVYVSGSRKAVLLGMSLILLVGIQLTKKYSRFKQLSILSSISVLFLIGSFYFQNRLLKLNDNILAISRIFEIFTGRESSFSEREWMIERGISIWLESPLIGSGLGEFAKVSGLDAYSHNNFIELLVSGGIIAFIFYYLLYILIICFTIKYSPNDIINTILFVITMLIIDSATVTFLSRSNMIFVVYLLSFFHKKDDRPFVDKSFFQHVIV